MKEMPYQNKGVNHQRRNKIQETELPIQEERMIPRIKAKKDARKTVVSPA